MGIRDAIKALRTPPSGGRDISADVQALTHQVKLANDGISQRNMQLAQLPVDPEWRNATFGPDWSLPPDALDKPNEQGFVDPRQYQYPVAWNIPGRHVFRGHVSWDLLKEAADQPLFRACIEIRKQRISTLDWCFRISPQYAAKMAKSSGKSQQEIEEDLRKQYQDEIDELTAFWQVPDRKNGYEFSDWMNLVQEEQLTWDALAIFPSRTYGGDLTNLTVLDGSTIKPLLDEKGGRPTPPFPAYQQILYGYPRGDYTADTVDRDGKLVVPDAYNSTQLIYRRRVVRTWTPYGFSPTEQALLDGQLWAKRFQWMLAEYTEGSQSTQYLVQKQQSDWDARQLLQYEKYLNDRNSGKTGQRYRSPLLPYGVEPANSPAIPERYKADYDLFLIKLQAMHFGVTMPELGFSEPGGLGSAGYHEGQEDIQFRKDLTSVRWLNSFVTGISRTHLNMSDAVEFSFLGLDEEDETAADQIDHNRLADGRATINENRVKIGLPPFDFKEADMPMLQTARGVVFLNGAAEAAPPGVLIEPAELNGEITPGTADGVGSAKVQGSPKPARPVKKAPSAADAAKEIEQFGKWLAKGSPGEFEFRALDDETAEALLKASGGGQPPKVSPSLQPLYSRAR
ncbi:hypothetical protein EAS64_33835 [Trebonia kvetii]|uniref:Phage portal protein n=2 Tax=Actinomycetes TaxID=1760 RepID=A0A6P2BQF0_9ACTN|nr:hypothetical protein [Trebonia kvetii]TVZ01262.1 hypothetical protein EAS64_33835 [Trebonia kvetii]